jgi:filamentous hemagglutinin family protein
MSKQDTQAKPRVIHIRIGGRKATLTWRPRKRLSALLQRMMSRAREALVAAILAGATGSVFAAPPVVNALPTGGQVVAGQATITQAGNGMTVVQGTDKAILNWGSFNIGSQASVDFKQPGMGSVALNRVVGNDASQIFGSLTANGSVFLVNPNGVMFGAGARVDVGGLVASTLNIRDDDFLKGNYRFARDGATGSVVNQGELHAADGGYVALLAPEVLNQGVVAAKLGTVAMAAGETITLDMAGDGLVSVKVDPATVRALVENRHLVQADGGRVIMAASAANALLGASVNAQGTIQAHGLVERDGAIYLDAGSNGDAVVTGKLDVSSATGQGGTVQVTGQRVGLFDGSDIDAKGAAGGGTVLAGGDWQGSNASVANAQKTVVGQQVTIDASATEQGHGGKVVVWADGDTVFAGNIKARGGKSGGDGGKVEVSGKENLSFTGTVDAGADQGKAGLLLLDPKNLTVVTSGGDTTPTGATVGFNTAPSADANVDAATITAITNTGTAVTLQANNDLTVNSSITTSPNNGVTKGGALTFQAGRSIDINAAIYSADGDVTFKFNDTAATSNRDAGDASFSNSGSIDAGTGKVTMVNGGKGASSTLSTGKVTAGQFDVTHLGSATGGVDLGELFVTGALNVTSNGRDITGSTRTIVNRNLATLNAGSGNITLNNANSDFSVVSAIGNNVMVRDQNAVQLGTSTVAGNLSVTTSGAVGSIGNVTVAGATTINATSGGFGAALSDVTLANNNDFQGALTVTSANGSVNIRDVNALALGSITGANVTLAAGGNISQSGVYTATSYSNITTTNAGTVVLGNAGNDFGSYLQVNTAGSATFVDKNDLMFGTGASTVAGNLSVTAAGNISQYNNEYNSAPLTVTGDASFTVTAAGKNLFLGSSNLQDGNIPGASNSIGGTVTLATSGAGSFQDIQLRNTNANAAVINGLTTVGQLRNVKLRYDNAPSVSLPGMTLTGNLQVYANSGGITQTGAIVVNGIDSNGYSTFLAGGARDIVLTDAGNNFNRITIAGGRSASIYDSNAIELSSTNGNFNVGTLSVTTNNGAITQSSNFNTVVSSATNLNAGTADITLNADYGNTWTRLAIAAARNATVRNTSGVLTLGDIALTGNLNLSSYNNGTLNQAANTSVQVGSNTTTSFTSFTNIALNNASNVLGNIAISNGSTISLRENDAITQSGAWYAPSSVSVTTANDQAINLSQAGNLFGGLTVTQENTGATSAGAVTIVESDNIAQNLAWTTHGNTTVNAQGYNVTLTNANNVLAPLQVLGGGTTAITAKDTAGKDAITDFAAWNTGFTTLNAYNSAGTVNGGGNISLTQAGNVLGDITLRGNTVTLTENSSITDNGQWVTTGTTTLKATNGPIALDNLTNVLGNIAIQGTPSYVLITENDAITQAAAWKVGAAPVTLNSRASGIDLTASGNVLGAIDIITTSGVPASVKITEDDAITQGSAWSLSGRNVDLVAENNKAITLGNVANQMGNLTITGGPVSITENDVITQGGAWTTTGTTSLTTTAVNAGVTLTNAANVLGNLAVSGATSVAITENDNITQASAWTLGTASVALNAGTHDVAFTQASNKVGDLVVTAANAAITENDLISDGAAWNVSGLTTLTAGVNKIVLDANPRSDFGTMKIVSADTADILAKNGLVFDTSTVTNGMTVNAGGAITQIGAIKADSLLLSGAGPVTLTNAGNHVNKLAAGLTGALNYTDNGTFDITNIGSTTGINVGANTVTLNAGGTVTGLGSVNSASTGLFVTTGSALSLPTMTIAGAQSYTSAAGITVNANVSSTAAGAITFTGPVTLANDLTVQSVNSAITFDGTLGGANKQLIVNGGTGAANFRGAVSNIGSAANASPVLQLTSGGATFDSTLQTNNGVSMTGPVTFKNDVTLGSAISNASSLFTGEVTLAKPTAQTLSAYSGLTFRNGLVLQNAAATVNSNNSALAFATAGTVRGAQGLTLNAGTGALTGLERIGTDLTSLSVTGSSLTLPGAGISIAGAQTYTATGGTAITLNGAVTSTAAGGVTFNGPTTLAGTTSVTTLNSNVLFNGTVDGARDLTVATGTGTKTFAGAFGSTIATGDGVGAALTLTGAGATSFADTVTTRSGINAQGPVTFAKAVAMANGDTGSTFGGAVTIGNTLSGYDGLAFNGGMSLTGATTVTSNGGTIALGGAVTGAQTLTLNALSGSTGAITGLNTLSPLLTGLSLTAQTLSLPANLAVAGAMNFTAPGGITVAGNVGSGVNGGAIAFNNGVTLTGDATIATANSAVTFAETLAGGARNLVVNTGTGAKTFTGAVTNVGTGTGAALTLQGAGASMFDSTVGANAGLLVQNGSATTFRNNVTLADGSVGTHLGAGKVTIGRSGATTTLSGFDGIETTAADLAGDVIVTSNNGAVMVGGALNGASNLTVNSGTGMTTFAGAIGNTTALGNGIGAALTLTGTGATVFQQATTLRSNLAATGDVTLAGNATAGGTNASTVAGRLTLGGASTVAANGGLTVAGGTTLAQGPVSISSSNSAITLEGGIDGAQALAVNAGAGSVQLSPVGASTALASLSVTGGNVSVGNVRTSGAQTYTGATTTANGALEGTGVRVNGALVTTAGTALNARTGTLNLNGTVTAGANPLRFIGDDVDLGGAISSTGTLAIETFTAGRAITLGASTPTAGSLSLTASELGQLPAGLSSLSIGVVDSGNLTLAGNVAAGTTGLALTTGGSITQTAGGLTSGALAVSAPGAVSLTSATNSFGAVSVSTPASALALTNTRDIVQGNAWALGTAAVTLDAGTHDITLNRSGNTFGVLSLKGRNATVQENAETTLGATTLGGTLTAASTAGITLGATTNITGNATLAAAGLIGQANAAKLTVGGDLSLTTTHSAGSVSIDNRGAAATVLGDTLVGGTYALDATGQTISQAAGTSVKVAGQFSPTGASVNLGNTGNLFGLLAISGATGTTVVKQNGVVTLGDRVEAGNLTVISEASSAVFGAQAIAGDAVGLSGAQNAIGGKISVTTVAPTIVSGGADVQTGIVQSANTTLKVTGNASFTATPSAAGTLGIDLSNAGNEFGSLNLTGDTIKVASSNAALVNSATALNGVEIASTGAVTIAGAVSSAAGDARVTSGADLTIATGGSVKALNGNALLATGTAGHFINNAGAAAVTTDANHRWLIYVGDKAGNTFGNLNSQNTAVWNATLAGLAPTSVTATGNRYLFNATPVLTFSGKTLNKTYGDALDVSSAFTIGGLETGVTNAYVGDSLATVLAGSPVVTSDGSAATAVVTASPYAIKLDGASLVTANGYTLGAVTDGTLTVDQRVLTVNATGSKVYDATTGLTGATFTLGNTVNSDEVAASGTTVFATKDAGAGKALSLSGVELSGAAAGNYRVGTTSGTGTITKAALAIGATGNDKTYDATRGATVALTDNRLGTDVLTLGYGQATFADKNAEANKAVSVAGITLAGTDANNYTFNTTTATTATINKAVLTVGATGANKTYDATTGAAVTLNDNRLGSDVLTLAHGGAAFSDKNAGNGKSITVSDISVTGTDAGNYTANTTASTQANIAKANLSISVSGVDKVYDTTRNAAVAYTDGRFTGDQLTISGTATFGDKNAGNGKAVTVSGIAVGGADAGNYTTTTTSALTSANVTKAALTVGATGIAKTYDATTTAAVTLNDNRLGNDQLTLAYGQAALADKNAGAAKAVNVSGITVTGTDAANYTANTTTTTTTNVAQASLTVGATGVDKVYDATTVAKINYTDSRFAGDQLTLSGNALFADKNAGANKAIAISGITAGGTDMGNYVLANTTALTTASISKAQLVATATGADKVYDGTTVANATLADNRLGTDQLTLGYASANFLDKNVGTGKLINVTGVTLSGTDAGNYTVGTTAIGSGAISKALLAVSLRGTDKVYDATTAATVSLVDNRVSNTDALSISYAGAAFADKNAGVGKAITVTGLRIVGADADNYTIDTSGVTNATANIAKATLTASATGVDKVYDATTGATVSLADNRLGTDQLTLAYGAAAFADKNAGVGKAVTVSGITLSGADAGNYVVNTGADTTATIGKAALTVGATGIDKIYDTTTAATVNLTDNRLANDSLTVAYGGASFADKNVGTNKAVTVSGLTIGGADAGNYVIDTTAATQTTASISKAALTIGATGLDKVYDATAAANVNLGDNRLGADQLTLGYDSAAFADKNAGNGKAVSVAGITVTGVDAGNYVANTTATTTANIAKAQLTVGATGIDKVYDTTTVANVNLNDNRLGTDQLTLGYGNASYADKNAGNGKTVSVAGLTVTGVDAGNYVANTTATTTANIAKATLAIGATGIDKVYDTTTVANVNLNDNRLGADQLTVGYGNAAFADKNAGNGKTVSVAGLTVTGADAGNYVVNTATATTANIAKAQLTVGANGIDKVYDATTAASVNLGDNRLGADQLTLGYGNASFADKNAGNGKAVSVAGISVTGADAGNYVANTTAATTANIAKAQLTVGATGIDKVYDTTTVANVNLNDNRLGTDSLSLAYGNAAFADKNAGNGKTVSVAGISVTGADAGNYVANTTTTTNASIAKAQLTVGATGLDKVYDTTTVAGVNLNDNRLDADQLTVSYGVAAFADKNAGAGKTVSVSGITVAGADAGNYAVNGGTTTTANIARAQLTVGATGIDKVYDTTTVANVNLNDNRLGADQLTLGYGNASFADKNVGNGKAVSVAGISVTGADAGNYVANTTAATTANIAKAQLTVGATGIDKVYDTTTVANVNLDDNRLGNDSLSLSYANAAFADKNAGSNKAVNVAGITVTGADAGNYLANTTASTTANVAQAALTVGATGIDKVYDATTNASVALADNRLGNDSLTLSYGNAAFADKNAGAGKLVNVAGIAIAGADAGNYVANTTAATTANIAKASLTVGATGTDKVYDTTTVANVNLNDNRYGNDQLSLGYGNAAFADKNAGSNKAVSVAGIAVTGADAGNYVANTTATTTANIAKAQLTVGATGIDKVYDTTTVANVNLNDNRLGADQLTLGYANAAFADKNAGAGKLVNVAGIAITGADAGNYVANTTAATTATIGKASLTVGAAGVDKVYDATTVANVNLIDNRLGADQLTLGYTNAAFADKNAGSNKAVNVAGITLGGADAGNYLANTTAATTANIAKAQLTVGATGIGKVYDTTTVASVNLNDNRLGADQLAVTYANAAYADKNAGANKRVDVAGISVTGADAANYVANTTATTTATIARAALTATATGIDKTYDASTAVTVALADNRLGNDSLTLSYANASVADKNAGLDKQVLVSGISVSGADAANYTVNGTASTTADIARASLTVTGTGLPKVYDGSTIGIVEFADNRIAGDNLTIVNPIAAFLDTEVGQGKTLNVSGFSLGGADAGNYLLASNSFTTTADIIAASALPPVLPPAVPPTIMATQTQAVLTPPPAATETLPVMTNLAMTSSTGGVVIGAATVPTSATTGNAANVVGATADGRAVTGTLTLVPRGETSTMDLAVQTGNSTSWSFKVPADAVKAVLPASAVAVDAVLDNGQALPAWLQFDAKTMTFTAIDAPAGALPLKAAVRFNSTSQVIDVLVTP